MENTRMRRVVKTRRIRVKIISSLILFLFLLFYIQIFICNFADIRIKGLSQTKGVPINELAEILGGDATLFETSVSDIRCYNIPSLREDITIKAE